MMFESRIGFDIYKLWINSIKLKILSLFDDKNNFSLIVVKKNFFFSYFGFEYNNEDEGYFIVGNYLHKYDNNYINEDFIYVKLGIDKNEIDWEIEFINYQNQFQSKILFYHLKNLNFHKT